MIDEHQLRTALQAPGGDDAAARERARRVVQAAAARLAPEPRRRRPVRLLAAIIALVVAAGATATARAPHSGVGRLVRDVLGVHAAPPVALVHVPGGGRLLVQAAQSTWVVQRDGHRRRLGTYDGASWSPGGLFVVAWRGGVLTALKPGGSVHWSLSRPDRITSARWSPGDGFRIAYLTGQRLRVVNGDGTGDREAGPALDSVPPTWRPGARHVLAYVDVERRVTVMAVDSGARLWRSPPLPAPVTLAWSPGGQRLLAIARHRLVIFDGAGHRLLARATDVAGGAAWRLRDDTVAVVRRDRAAGASEVILLSTAQGVRERVLVRGPGRFGPPAWSPDGSALLVPWPAAGQWLFLRVGDRPRTVAVANVARQFAPGAARPPFPSQVQWCCTPALAP